MVQGKGSTRKSNKQITIELDAQRIWLNDPKPFTLLLCKWNVIQYYCCCCLQVNQTPDSCQETKFKVINLEEGALYRFRVVAVNAAGESDPTNIREPIRVQDRLGESSAHHF